MHIVGNDPEAVEADLAEGRLRCPACKVGVLSRWGFAIERSLRDGAQLRPRRAICSKKRQGCGTTHVLLPDICLAHHLDAVGVIGEALRAVLVDKTPHDDVARLIAVPPDTVLGWLRRFRRRAGEIAAHFGRWLVSLAPGEPLPELDRSLPVHALELIGAVAKAASLVLMIRPAWSWASALSAGRLISNTKSPWPAPD